MCQGANNSQVSPDEKLVQNPEPSDQESKRNPKLSVDIQSSNKDQQDKKHSSTDNDSEKNAINSGSMKKSISTKRVKFQEQNLPSRRKPGTSRNNEIAKANLDERRQERQSIKKKGRFAKEDGHSSEEENQQEYEEKSPLEQTKFFNDNEKTNLKDVETIKDQEYEDSDKKETKIDAGDLKQETSDNKDKIKTNTDFKNQNFINNLANDGGSPIENMLTGVKNDNKAKKSTRKSKKDSSDEDELKDKKKDKKKDSKKKSKKDSSDEEQKLKDNKKENRNSSEPEEESKDKKKDKKKKGISSEAEGDSSKDKKNKDDKNHTLESCDEDDGSKIKKKDKKKKDIKKKDKEDKGDDEKLNDKKKDKKKKDIKKKAKKDESDEEELSENKKEIKAKKLKKKKEKQDQSEEEVSEKKKNKKSKKDKKSEQDQSEEVLKKVKALQDKAKKIDAQIYRISHIDEGNNEINDKEIEKQIENKKGDESRDISLKNSEYNPCDDCLLDIDQDSNLPTVRSCQDTLHASEFNLARNLEMKQNIKNKDVNESNSNDIDEILSEDLQMSQELKFSSQKVINKQSSPMENHLINLSEIKHDYNKNMASKKAFKAYGLGIDVKSSSDESNNEGSTSKEELDSEEESTEAKPDKNIDLIPYTSVQNQEVNAESEKNLDNQNSNLEKGEFLKTGSKTNTIDKKSSLTEIFEPSKKIANALIEQQNKEVDDLDSNENNSSKNSKFINQELADQKKFYDNTYSPNKNTNSNLEASTEELLQNNQNSSKESRHTKTNQSSSSNKSKKNHSPAYSPELKKSGSQLHYGAGICDEESSESYTKERDSSEQHNILNKQSFKKSSNSQNIKNEIIKNEIDKLIDKQESSSYNIDNSINEDSLENHNKTSKGLLKDIKNGSNNNSEQQIVDRAINFEDFSKSKKSSESQANLQKISKEKIECKISENVAKNSQSKLNDSGLILDDIAPGNTYTKNNEFSSQKLKKYPTLSLNNSIKNNLNKMAIKNDTSIHTDSILDENSNEICESDLDKADNNKAKMNSKSKQKSMFEEDEIGEFEDLKDISHTRMFKPAPSTNTQLVYTKTTKQPHESNRIIDDEFSNDNQDQF